ncbi:hypothetical protein ACIQVU_07850 [Lysinibacillus sp. NPDC098008]|uniref:hypothetical protein n=1 Tax=Lysinibacillus sp. NPDC098008 TaxID=3364146 RepID=UPI0037FC6473
MSSILKVVKPVEKEIAEKRQVTLTVCNMFWEGYMTPDNFKDFLPTSMTNEEKETLLNKIVEQKIEAIQQTC